MSDELDLCRDIRKEILLKILLTLGQLPSPDDVRKTLLAAETMVKWVTSGEIPE